MSNKEELDINLNKLKKKDDVGKKYTYCILVKMW